MNGGDVFEAHYSPSRSILLGALSILFVVGGLWFIGAFGELTGGSRRVPEWALSIIGWVSIVFFAPIGVFHFKKAFSPGIAVRVDEHGILMQDYASVPIPWEDFTEIATQNMMGTNMLLFEVVEDRRESFGVFKRMLWAINKPFNGRGGSLVINNTNRSHRDMIAAIKQFGPPRMTQFLR